MTQTIILPTLQRKEFPEVMKMSYNAMGLLAINFFNSNYKNFLKLFMDKIENNLSGEFKEFEMVSLFIMFDSLLQHNLNELQFMDGKVNEKIDYIIKKYLYHYDDVPRIIAFTGLCKLLIANRIGRPEFVLARLISVLYKSFDLTDRKKEDFHIKIFEIMQNFLYVYSYTNKNHIKTFVKAILIILTSHMMGDSSINYQKSVSTDFMETKVEFLNQMVVIVQEFAQGRQTMRKIIFKIFKYLYFIYTYTHVDFQKELELDGDISKNLTKKIEVKYKNKTSLKANLAKFFNKTKYDLFLLNEMSDESAYIKFLPFILCLDDTKAIKFFSENLEHHFNKLKENNFSYDISGRKMEFGSEEQQHEMREKVNNKEMKYYKLIEDNYEFINSLKECKLNTIPEENSRIYEDDDNLMEDENPKHLNEISMKKANVKNKGKSKESQENKKNIDSKINNKNELEFEEKNKVEEYIDDKGNSALNISNVSNKRSTRNSNKSNRDASLKKAAKRQPSPSTKNEKNEAKKRKR